MDNLNQRLAKDESLTFIYAFVHFMKWIAKYIWICSFHIIDNFFLDFMK